MLSYIDHNARTDPARMNRVRMYPTHRFFFLRTHLQQEGLMLSGKDLGKLTDKLHFFFTKSKKSGQWKCVKEKAKRTYER